MSLSPSTRDGECMDHELPAGYPDGYELTVVLADGRPVDIRPVIPSDSAGIAEAIRTSDYATLHARFIGGPPPLTDAALSKLTELDYRDRFALAAFDHAHGVGIARYIRLDPSTAEVAVVVAPEWRRVGLATALIEHLARRAQECGITEFTAIFLADNRPVIELARGGHAHVAIATGMGELNVSLEPSDSN
jgi:GNAT superfamily N-acetyltransferase